MENHTYLLDTNILSDLIRRPNGVVLDRLEAILPDTACTSIIVAAEIFFGISKKASARLAHQAIQILAAIDILPLESPVEKHYGDIRAHLTRTGQPIGSNDLFIAAHARALNMVLVTANVREFSRVPELMVENWL